MGPPLSTILGGSRKQAERATGSKLVSSISPYLCFSCCLQVSAQTSLHAGLQALRFFVLPCTRKAPSWDFSFLPHETSLLGRLFNILHFQSAWCHDSKRFLWHSASETQSVSRPVSHTVVFLYTEQIQARITSDHRSATHRTAGGDDCWSQFADEETKPRGVRICCLRYNNLTRGKAKP